MNASLTPVTLDADILQRMMTVSRLIGRLEGINLLKPVPKLRDQNRSRTVHGSTAIEGNPCTLKDVEDIMRGSPVLVSPSKLLEVRNALAAYDALRDFSPYEIGSFLRAHAVLMGGGLMLGAGLFRREPVEVYISETETRAMPPWRTVEPRMRELFSYLAEDADPVLLKSVRFHFECVNLHPFTDGNGRVARLWQTRLLMEFHPVFEFLDVESMIYEKRMGYYACIRESQERGDAAGFVRFMLDRLVETLDRLWESSGHGIPRRDDRLHTARVHFGSGSFTRKDYLTLFKTIVAVTASRDLKAGVDSGALHRQGDNRTTVYQFL